MITADISHFTGQYTQLNQTGQNLNISKFMLARSVMMVGHRGFVNSLSNLGFMRLAQLLCYVLANIETQNGYLQLNSSFFQNIVQSEKVTISYHLGMGLAKACAEILLGIPWLRHLSRHPNVVLSKNGNIPSKVNLYTTTYNPREPDLIGFDQLQQPHIFEAKGYSSGMRTSALQHAIDQVSQVVSVNGMPPATKVACFFDMSGSPINGTIVDPNGDDNDETGITIKIDFQKYIHTYYLLFVDDKDWLDTREIEAFGRRFKIRAIGAPKIYFGIDSELFLAVLKRKSLRKHINYFADNFDTINEHSSESDFSIGLDGTILFNRANLGNQYLRKILSKLKKP